MTPSHIHNFHLCQLLVCVSPINNIKQLIPGEVPVEERTVVADDWGILKFENDPESKYRDAVNKWKDDDLDGKDYIIIGYPGGRTAFDGDVVEPTEIPAQFPFRAESNGALTLLGSQTVPGTSGGGIFDSKSNAFAGIHRSRIDSTVQVQGVSAKKIREILLERGYEPPNGKGTGISPRERGYEPPNGKGTRKSPRERGYEPSNGKGTRKSPSITGGPSGPTPVPDPLPSPGKLQTHSRKIDEFSLRVSANDSIEAVWKTYGCISENTGF